jgi:hypothetical protein
METGSHRGEPGDGGTLAPIWVCSLLAGNFQSTPESWPEKDFQRGPRPDLSDGRGELHLGRPTFNECHLKRLLADYIRYYYEDRTHLGLRKETPAGRVRSTDRGAVVSRARLGGLHHRYVRAA